MTISRCSINKGDIIKVRLYKDQRLSLDKGKVTTAMVTVGPSNRPEAASFVVAGRGAGER